MVGPDADGNTDAFVRTAPDSPGELRRLPTTANEVPTSDTPLLLASEVEMVRQVQGDYEQLPDEIEAQAPG